MPAVGGDEVDQRLGVLDALAEVAPALVGLEVAVVRRREQLAPEAVQRWHAGLAGPGEVQGGEVERQAEEVVAQGVGHELVAQMDPVGDR